MKKLLLLLAVLVTGITFAQIGINTSNPEPSAALDITSTTGGLLVPRMTEAQRDAISSAATGLMIYQTDGTAGFYYYNGSSWEGYYSKNEIDALVEGLQSQIDDIKKLTDQNGNKYDYLTYGDQVWTVENAEMVSYRDGTPIPEVTDNDEWATLTTGAWCYYDNDPNKGKLYNWYAVVGIHDDDPNTPNKEFAPEGWHVPSKLDWVILQEYLIANGYNYDSSSFSCSPCPPNYNKIAQSLASTAGWISSGRIGTPGYDQNSNNRSGFNALAEGWRIPNGLFTNEDQETVFWASDESEIDESFFFNIYVEYIELRLGSKVKESGFSVRFVRG